VLVVWLGEVIESGLSQVLEGLAQAVGKLGFSLLVQIDLSSEQEQLAVNLAPAVVVWLGDKSDPTVLANL